MPSFCSAPGAARCQAGTKKLVLFHHDPNHSDVALEQVLKLAREKYELTILARERALVRF